MKSLKSVILIASTIWSTSAACAQSHQSNTIIEGGTITYNIKPVPLKDRTQLEISVHFKTQNDSALMLNLPQDYYGVPDLYTYVGLFRGDDGCIVKPADTPNQRLVIPNYKNEVSISYILSYDPEILDGFSFAPNVSASHFHVAGCQWMLPIGDILVKHNYDIKIVDAPINWHFYASMAASPEHMLIYDSYENLISSAIGGGAQAYTALEIQGKPVYVFVAGDYTMAKDEIFKAVNKIVALQRDWFNDYEFPFYNVTILPRSGIIAGTCIPNLFVCFIKSEISQDELNVLFSHEKFHTWLPNKIHIKLAKGEYSIKYEWFTEGFADYFARKILLDAGLLSEQNFADLINRDIINIADNPNHTATYADIIAAAKSGTYTTAFKKLSYYKGALIALKWETQIRNVGNGKQLKDLLRDLYDLAFKNNAEISEQNFFDLAMTYGIDAKNDMEQFIIQGLPIQLLPDALGTQFELKQQTLPSFDPGFSLAQTFKTRKISEVVENGQAYKAGLRNDMDFVAINNSNRFGNGWSPDKPLAVTVTIDGQDKTVEYFPHGQALTVNLYTSDN